MTGAEANARIAELEGKVRHLEARIAELEGVVDQLLTFLRSRHNPGLGLIS